MLTRNIGSKAAWLISYAGIATILWLCQSGLKEMGPHQSPERGEIDRDGCSGTRE